MNALGLDFGGVILPHGDRSDDTSFWGDNYLECPAVPGMFEAISRLVTGKFGFRTYIVSFARRQTTVDRSSDWMYHHQFFEQTGVNPANVHFCRQHRNEKAIVAARFGLTHFVDDRLENLGHLTNVPVPNLYLFRPNSREVEKNVQFLNLVTTVQEPSQLANLILAT